MSIYLSERPFDVDFAQNSLSAKFNCTPNQISGVKFYKQFAFTSLPAVNKKITFTFNNTSLTFTIAQYVIAAKYPDKMAVALNTAKLLESFEDKIVYHYLLNKYYDISAVISGNVVIVTFAAKEVGSEYNLTITTDDRTVHYTAIAGSVAGVNRVKLSNYFVFAQLLIKRYSQAIQETIRTPEMIISVDENSQAKLQLDILKGYFEECDVPNITDSIGGYPLQYATILYNILYAEVYGDTPAVQIVKKSEDLIALNAKEYEYPRSVNLPDWITFHNEKKISEYDQPRNYGSTNNLTVKSYKDLPQYLYFILVAGADQSDTYRIDLLLKDGTVVSSHATGQILFQHNAITRIPVSFRSLGLDLYLGDILSYTINFTFSGLSAGDTMIFKRTFILEEKPFFAKEFLLQNKYGVLESFFIENQLVEKETEGNKVVKNGATEIDFTNKSTIYTARTGAKTKEEMQLLSDALEQKFNYRILNNKTYLISILPNTFTITDEAEDLQSAEFSYILNIAANNIGTENVAETDTNIYLFENSTVWDDNRVWGDHIQVFFTTIIQQQ